jgi:hypothetical protein
MDQLVDPVLADFQTEYEAAIRQKRIWHSRWLRIAGYVVFLKVMAWYGGQQCIERLVEGPADDHRAVARAIGFAVPLTVASTVLLEVPPLLIMPSHAHPNFARLVVLLVPQALALALPIGFTLGLLMGIGTHSLSPHLRRVIILLAVMCSAASLANLAWITPAANQAFRVSVFGGPVLKGGNELTIHELRELLGPATREAMVLAAPNDRPDLALLYHTRWALSFATLALTWFALVLKGKRLVRGVVMCVAFVSYYMLLYGGRQLVLAGTVPPYAAAWLPNAALIFVSATCMARPPSRPVIDANA